MPVNALSVVIPIYNEQENVAPLAEEVAAALSDRLPYELIFVDDKSKDNSVAEVQKLTKKFPQVRLVTHAHNRGQSAAVVTGVSQAQHPWVATLDGDCQNDPKDLLALIQAVDEFGEVNILCMGQRQKRQDNWLRKCSSRVANSVRRKFLKDDCPDSGCGIKLFYRERFLTLPLFKNCHRFLPVLFARAGAAVKHVPVSHRPRAAGVSKYGVMNRLWAGIVDMIGVAWLMRRHIERELNKDV